LGTCQLDGQALLESSSEDFTLVISPVILRAMVDTTDYEK
jgi:hypothetical protein